MFISRSCDDRSRRVASWLVGLLVGALGFPAAAAPETVLVFLGKPGAGKSTVAGIIAKRTQAPQWSSGDAIRNTIKARGLPYTIENDRAMREEFARSPGQIGRTLAAEVNGSPSRVAIVEGFRDPAELAAFKKSVPHAKVVAVEVSQGRRFARMLERRRAGEDTVPILKDRDKREVALGIEKSMRMADVRMRPRAESLGDLELAVDRFMKQQGIAGTGAEEKR
jgi:adenylate kinase family enzyme